MNGDLRSAAVILCGGTGKRMGTNVPKQYMLLKGAPLVYYTLMAFEDSKTDDIILVTGAGDEKRVREEIVEAFGFKKVRAVICGGAERYDSSFEGIKKAAELKADIVMIHDGARPLVTKDIIERCLEDVKKFGSAVTAVASKDTVKIRDKDGYVTDTPERASVVNVQTPQCFKTELILAAYGNMYKSRMTAGITDDAMVAERFSDIRVHITEGSYENIKVTTPEDRFTAETLLGERGF